jgi:phosphatidylethanolamine-binding protein (PEBP) family uncharacterized protein
MEGTDTVPSGTLDEAPSSKITITYPSGKTVEFGKELTPTDVKDEPQVSWEADPAKYYTLLMFDPDAPSRQDPKSADVKHWLVVNILGCDVKSGEVIAEYAGSGPPQGTGLHRYIFLVFEQKDRMEFDEPKSEKGSRANRVSWSMRGFMKKNNLRKAFAGNYYVAQWDAYVDERRKQMRD